ncbi:kinesin motor family protein isoform X2 [Wolffia australiana]
MHRMTAQSSSSSSRGRSSSPFGQRRPYSSSSLSNSSSSSSLVNGRLIPRSCPSPGSSHGLGSGYASGMARSVPVGRARSGSSVDLAVAEEQSAGSRGEMHLTGESIAVTIRFRPMSDREFQRGDEIAWYADGDKIVRNEYNPATAYAFDRVFGPSTPTKVVYEVAAKPVVKAAMEGINGTVFAYGVTSSGKTHTMHGEQTSPGIIPLAIKDVFSMIQDTPGREFLLRVSYLEIYNEVINDLLDPTGQNLRVREDAQGTYVEGIKEEVVLSPGHALSFVAAGEEHRHVGSNNFNLLSSRSHTIFTLMIESSAHGDEYDGVIYSQLNLIDLAGSESSKTETTGLRRKEGSYINKSLLTLGTVIGKLSEGKASHVPYRDSKLTRLLQSSLSGRGHVSLICTVTPASSNIEETHNTLKFASRAKRVEIYASRNKIIDEKSLIKKYQREISRLKEELDQLKKGMIAGINQEEILTLRQKLEEGQVKMQSRLEEEEEAKAALMSRIQRLTKLILVSTKNTVPGCLTDVPSHVRGNSSRDDNKVECLSEESALSNGGMAVEKDFFSLSNISRQMSSDRSNGDQSSTGSLAAESSRGGERITGSFDGFKIHAPGMTASDQKDLLTEQVKMLAGEIAFSKSTLKRLTEHSTEDPEASKTQQIQSLENEIAEKQKQMSALEEQIAQIAEPAVDTASLLELQHKVMKLMTQCSEKGFELELRTADNRILQDQLQEKCAENKKLQERVQLLESKLRSVRDERSSAELAELEELKRLLANQEAEKEKILEEKKQLAEEAAYAKELASSAGEELKNLAEEVTRLSKQNARQARELMALQPGRRAARRPARPGSEGGPGVDELRAELVARRQREAALEAALAEREEAEEELRRRFEEARRREAALEGELAGMWVVVARLRRGSEVGPDEARPDCALKEHNANTHPLDEPVKEGHLPDPAHKPPTNSELEPLLVRLKARIQGMKEKEPEPAWEGDANSHVRDESALPSPLIYVPAG